MMGFHPGSSIGHKLMLIILGISLVAILLSTFTFFLIGLQEAKRQLHSELIAEAEVLSFNCTGTLVFDDPARANIILSALQYEEGFSEAGILNANGDLFAFYSREGDPALESAVVLADGFHEFGNGLTLFHSVVLDGERIGTVFITADHGFLDEVRTRYLWGWAGSVLIAMLLATFLTTRLQRLILRPLVGLAETARSITNTRDYSERALVVSSDEVGDLVVAFNDMLDQIHLRQEELAALFRLGRLVDFSRSTDHILNLAVGEVVDPLNASGVFLCLLVQEKLVLQEFWMDQGEGQLEDSIDLPNDKKMNLEKWCTLAIGGDGPMLFSVEDGAEKRDRMALGAMGFHGFVGLPLLSGGQLVGVLGLVSRQDVGFAHRLAFMETLASHVAVAVQNTLLFARAKSLSDKLEQKVATRTQELAEANERLTELDRMKSVFLASMSHELRTPLNSIIGFTGVLLKGMSGELNEEQSKQLTIVKRSSKHLLELISDVLDISKIEAGKVDLDIEEFDLVELVRSMVESVRSGADQAGLNLTLESPEHLLVISDERRIKQILLNLLSNAIKFTPTGQISVLVINPEQGRFQIMVKDTGVGLDAADQDKLFMPFQQLTGELTRKAEGTGLGLYLSAQIARMLGGNITVDSVKGHGSEFNLNLPLECREEEL